MTDAEESYNSDDGGYKLYRHLMSSCSLKLRILGSYS